MNEIKPTWRIAQEISRRHTLISLKIILPLLFASMILSIISLKILGYQHPGIVLKEFFSHNRQSIVSVIAFIHFIPINFYAIVRVLNFDFGAFRLKVVPRDSSQ